MSLGTKTLTGGGASAAVVAAEKYRDYILIQLQSNHPTYLGFGETAVTSQGVCLCEPGASVVVRGAKARGVINAIAAGNAILGYETTEGVEYRSGQFAGPWPTA